MIEGLYISGSGMIPKATRQEAVANNLANVEVPGFKRDSMFLREVREAMKRQSGDYPDWRINRFEGTWTDFEQGKLQRTDNAFDVALNGKGFLAVRTPEGIQYTRNGALSRSGQGVLVNLMGYPVLDPDGAEIVIPERFDAPIIDASGTVRGRDEQTGEDQVLGRLQLTDFPELYDANAKAQTPYQPPLKKGKDGFFIPSPATRRAEAQGVQVVQGFVESSNVEPVLEMVRMIDLYRSYEADYRAIQVQDSTLERAVNDVGRAG
jgi:flagellar basal-body rod protein FlgG